jgi:predicted neuraminidase
VIAWGDGPATGIAGRVVPAPGARILAPLLAAVLLAAGCQYRGSPASTDPLGAQPGIVGRELICPPGRFPMCHASTIAESDGGLVAAWFAGSHEGWDDVAIWMSRQEPGGTWSAPRQVADGVQSPGERVACWNPVLVQPARGPLLLFHQVGPNPRAWWGVRQASRDGGRTWDAPERLPPGQHGPIRNKPLALADGTLLCPTSTEAAGPRPFAEDWRAFIAITSDLGRTWTTVGPLNDPREFAAIQPTLLRHADGRLRALCRTRQGVIAQAVSADQGRGWGPMTRTALPNPNSGIDALTLSDGRHLLVYNHLASGRGMLNVALSADGERWQAALVLEDGPGEYSYPAVIQATDGLVHITYTWRRVNLRHVVVDPRLLVARDFVAGAWPVARE